MQEKGASRQIADSLFEIIEIDDYSLETLAKTDIFQSDTVVILTSDQGTNATLAKALKQTGINRVIASIQSPNVQEELKDFEIEFFSVLLAQQTLLRATIESPSVMKILTNQDTSLYEISMLNEEFAGIELRMFPFTGDVIFVRIFRGKDSLVPHGDTELQINDHLVVTGSKKYVDQLKRELEFCE